MVQTGNPIRRAASAINRADSPNPDARESSPAMAMPGAVTPDRGEGLGASHPVACAKARRRRVGGRPRQNACGAVRRKESAGEGMVCGCMPRLSPAKVNNRLKSRQIRRCGSV